MTTTHPLGAALREARVAAGMSQAQLAQATGINQARLSRYESGKIQPRPQALSLIAIKLRLPTSFVSKYAYHDLAWREQMGVVQ